MNTSLLKALEVAQREDLRTILSELLPPIIAEALKKPVEDKLLKKYQVCEAWGVSKATGNKYLALAVKLGQIDPVSFNGMMRYRQNEILRVNLRDLKKPT